MTPQLALRVAIVGSIVLALFAILFFRLWFLQVLSGSQYVAQAQVNRVRDRRDPRPARRDPRPRQQRAGQLHPGADGPDRSDRAAGEDVADQHPPSARGATRRYSTGSRTSSRCRPGAGAARSTRPTQATRGCRRSPATSPSSSLQPFGDVTVKQKTRSTSSTTSPSARTNTAACRCSRPRSRATRRATLAAQVLGTVGQITRRELKSATTRARSRARSSARAGLEAQYDQYLRGRDGKQQVEIDAQGIPTGIVKTDQPIAGHNLQTSLDTQVQRVGQASLAQSVDRNGGGAGGAFVAMNPDNGEIYAMGSNPSFDPSVFTGSDHAEGLRREVRRQLRGPAAQPGDPVVGPTGSNYKPITAVAALRAASGAVDQAFDDTGKYCVGSGAASSVGRTPAAPPTARSTGPGDQGLRRQLLLQPRRPDERQPVHSSPRRPAAELVAQVRDRPQPRDRPARRPESGTLPDPRWRNAAQQARGAVRRRRGVSSATPNGHGYSSHQAKGFHRSAEGAPAGSCGIADGTDRPWTEGDNENLAVGQGDVQVSPLQLALAYSAIANGGTIVTPHIGMNIENADGTVLQKVGPAAPQAQPAHQPALSRHDPPGSARGRADAGRHLRRRDGQLPASRCTARPAPPSTSRRRPGEIDYAWYSCFVPGDRDQQADRGHGLGREGRLRRHRRGAGRPPDPVAVVPRQARSVHQRQLDRRVSTSTPTHPRRADGRAARRALPVFDPLLLLAGIGLVVLLVSDAARRGRQLRGRQAGAVRRRRGVAGAGDQPDRLLATARVQARAVRGDDRARPGRLRVSRRSPARGAGSRCRDSASSPRSSASCC